MGVMAGGKPERSEPERIASCRGLKGLLGILLLAAAMPGLVAAASAREPHWSQYERDSAIARKKDWLVVSPGGDAPCFLKQSYQGGQQMEMLYVRGGGPLVCGPFYREDPGRAEVSCSFARGEDSRSFSRTEVTNCIRLPQDLLPGFKSGISFRVEVRLPDREGKTLRQEFSLMGFTAAHSILMSDTCHRSR